MRRTRIGKLIGLAIGAAFAVPLGAAGSGPHQREAR